MILLIGLSFAIFIALAGSSTEEYKYTAMSETEMALVCGGKPDCDDVSDKWENETPNSTRVCKNWDDITNDYEPNSCAPTYRRCTFDYECGNAYDSAFSYQTNCKCAGSDRQAGQPKCYESENTYYVRVAWCDCAFLVYIPPTKYCEIGDPFYCGTSVKCNDTGAGTTC